MKERENSMDEYSEVLRKTGLFKGLDENDVKKAITCLEYKIKKVSKGAIVLDLEENVSSLGIVLSGGVQVSKLDISGDKMINATIEAGGIFAETFLCAGIKKSPVIVTAISDSDIMFLDFKRVTTTCGNACLYHGKLIENMLGILANKNIMLNEKIDILTKKNTREKIMTFLQIQSKQQGSKLFKIPFNREELANFLAVDRSALSRELSEMQKEGLIRFKKDEFTLI